LRRALVLALAIGACTPDFESEQIVKDLRVLGISADTPEILLEGGPLSMQEHLCLRDEVIPGLIAELAMHLPETLPTVTLRPLVADPHGGGRPVHFVAVACLSPTGAQTEEGGGNNMPGGVRETVGRGACPDDALVLGQGDSMPAANAATVPIEVRLPLTSALLLAAVRQDPLGLIYGLPITVQLTVSAGEEKVIARKRVLVTTRLTAEQVPNHNPVITRLVHRKDENDRDGVPFDLEDPLREPLLLHLGEKVMIEPVQGDKEMYPARVGDRNTGCVQTKPAVEALRYAYFATAGGLSPDTTNTEPPVFRGPATNDQHRLATTYEAPKALLPGESDLVRIWVVNRDERAGASFVEIALRLVP
jgi:hypothetical protein